MSYHMAIVPLHLMAHFNSDAWRNNNDNEGCMSLSRKVWSFFAAGERNTNQISVSYWNLLHRIPFFLQLPDISISLLITPCVWAPCHSWEITLFPHIFTHSGSIIWCHTHCFHREKSVNQETVNNWPGFLEQQCRLHLSRASFLQPFSA